MKTSIITVANQKGGVAKTTSVCNLAASYALNGNNVLVVDLDYQFNLTSLFDISKEEAEKKSISRVISEQAKLDELIIQTKFENIDIISCSRKLNDLRDTISGEVNQFHFLKDFFDNNSIEKYDIVLIDTHPSIDLFFKAALVASHYYLIPLFAEADSCRGLAHQIEEAEKVSKYFNPMLTLLGAFITKFDKRNTTHLAFAKAIEEAAKISNFHLFKTIIPASVAVAGAAASSVPLNKYKSHLNVSTAYNTLAGEILPLLKGRRTGRKNAPVKTDILSNCEFEQTLSI